MAEKTKIKPLGDRALVERTEGLETTAGGIVIPGTAKEKLHEGFVRYVGPGSRRKDGTLNPMPIKVGDKIIYGKYSGSEIKLDGKEYVVVREDDIIGIVE